MKYTLSKFTVKEEKTRDAKRAIAELVAAVRENEPRTLYLVFREERKSAFFTLVSFENEAAWRRHAQSSYVNRFAKKLLPICEGKPVFLDVSQFASSRKQWLLEQHG
jgi:quinol monooxygenase YgiN